MACSRAASGAATPSAKPSTRSPTSSLLWIAPALLIYESFLKPWPVLGWPVAGYAACGAWRLARFASVEKTPFFQGLPITMAYMSVSAFLFYPQFWSPRAVAFVTLVVAVLMISHLRFPKIPMLLRPLPTPVSRRVGRGAGRRGGCPSPPPPSSPRSA